MSVTPYLMFGGRSQDAIDFYQKALGAEVEMQMRFSEGPQNDMSKLPADWNDKVMHACLKVGGSQIMMSDGMCAEATKFEGISLSFEVPDRKTADTYFAALAEGGAIRQPMIETFFAPGFGIVADKFGVSWMIVVAQS